MCQTPTWLIISFPDQNLSRLYYLQNKFQILYHDISRPSFPGPKLSPILIFYYKLSTCQSVILTWSPDILHCPCSHCSAPSSPPPASSSHWNSTGISRCLESNPPIVFPDSWADFSHKCLKFIPTLDHSQTSAVVAFQNLFQARVYFTYWATFLEFPITFIEV